MKSEQFVKYFFEAVKNSISHSEKFRKKHASRLENFAKTCRCSLEEILRNSKITEITSDNFRTFSKLYLEKLGELVANERIRHTQKVHWISQAAADIANETIHQVFQEKIQKEAVARASMSIVHAAASKPSVLPSLAPAPASAMVAQPALPPAPAKAAALILSAFSVALKPKPTSKVNWTDAAFFQKDDYDSADLSDHEKSIFEFASNCCAYPRLVVYLSNAHKFNPRYSCIAINMLEAENVGATQFTPNQVLALTKDAEKAKKLAFRCG